MPSTAWSSGASSKTMFAALPPSSRVRPLSVPATPLAMSRPISVEPVNATLSTPLWVTSDIPTAPGPGHDVDDAGRQVRLLADVGEQERGERRRGRGLQDDGVAGGQCRGDLPGQHEQREVPRDDLGGDAERVRRPARERVLELVRPAGVVPEVRRGERHVDVATLLDRLAGVHRFEDGELARALLHDPRDPEQVLGTLTAGQGRPTTGCRPVARPGRPCRCPAGVAFATWARTCSVAGSTVGERPAVRRLDLAAADEQAVALLERDDVAGLGGRRILPRDRLAVAETPTGRSARRARATGTRGSVDMACIMALTLRRPRRGPRADGEVRMIGRLIRWVVGGAVLAVGASCVGAAVAKQRIPSVGTGRTTRCRPGRDPGTGRIREPRHVVPGGSVLLWFGGGDIDLRGVRLDPAGRPPDGPGHLRWRPTHRARDLGGGPADAGDLRRQRGHATGLRPRAGRAATGRRRADSVRRPRGLRRRSRRCDAMRRTRRRSPSRSEDRPTLSSGTSGPCSRARNSGCGGGRRGRRTASSGPRAISTGSLK